MPRPCSICRHAQVAKIDADLISGVTYRTVAARYGTSTATVVRHRAHISKALEKAKSAIARRSMAGVEKQVANTEAREAAYAETVLDRLMTYHRTIQELLTEARESKDHAGALRAVQAGLKQLELESRLLGELKDHSGAGAGLTVQVVYVNANSGAAGRGDDHPSAADREQIIEVVSQKA